MKDINTEKNLELVREFHETYGHPVEDDPILPDLDRQGLRESLLEEEFYELKKAISDADIVAIADALCDLQYVLSGTVLEFGLGNKFRELMDEVHRSNMSKVCSTPDQVARTISYYRKERGVKEMTIKIIPYSGNTDGVGYIIYDAISNKVLKNVDYSPPNLKSILDK